MNEQQARDKMVDNLAADFVGIASKMGWSAKIDLKRTKPEKRERKIDGELFQGWYRSSDNHVTEGMLISTYIREGRDVPKQITIAKCDDVIIAQAVNWFPALMRAAIDVYNSFDEYDYDSEDKEKHDRMGEVIRQAGFGSDLKDGL